MKKLLLLAITAMTLLTGCGMGTVAEGNAAIVYGTTGKFAGTVGPGFYWKPFQRVDEYMMKEITIPFENMRPKAQDDLSLQDLDVDIAYRVTSQEALARLALKRSGSSAGFKGDDFYMPAYNYVKNVTDSEISDATSKFNSMQIHKSRDALAAAIHKQLQDTLNVSDPGDIKVTRVQVRRALPDASIEEGIRRVINKGKEKEAADLEKGIAQALADANAKKTVGLSEQVLQEKYLDALKTCAANQHCTMIIDGSTSSKMLNIGK
jgi:regulator of protease activity HflC (stomatin/prohibitin superfamily)